MPRAYGDADAGFGDTPKPTVLTQGLKSGEALHELWNADDWGGGGVTFKHRQPTKRSESYLVGGSLGREILQLFCMSKGQKVRNVTLDMVHSGLKVRHSANASFDSQ